MTAFGEEEIFQVARRIDRPEARRLYLDQVCGADADLRARLAAPLRAHHGGRSFLERPAVPPPGSTSGFEPAGEPTTAPPPDALPESAGAAVGPYKLLEQIGEGGFGAVWMAEQQHPVRQKVALKVL